MTTTPSGSGLNHSANWWSRILGVSLRPWSGTSPARLLISGVFQTVLCVFFVWLAIRLATDDELAELGSELTQAGERPVVGIIAGLIGLVAVGVGILALLRLAAGVIDLFGSREVSGVVVSIGDRRTLDVLPTQIAQMILNRGRDNHGGNTRRYRTELVVDTGSGIHQWTIHDQRTVRNVNRGVPIRMRVTPIAGHVSDLTVLSR